MDVSIIVPLYNEEENIQLGYDELATVLNKNFNNRFEIIYVDDGSTDNTWDVLSKLVESTNMVQVLKLRKNFGQSSAIAAGLSISTGEVVVLIDGDLQNDPRDIPMLVGKLVEEKLDIVSGWRQKRKDNLISIIIPSKIANYLISMITGVRLRDYGCTLKAYRGELIRGLPLYGELHRFLPAIATSMGATVLELPVNHRSRRFGKSKYGLGKSYKVVLDLIKTQFFLRYYESPLYFFGKIGFWISVPGLLVGGYYSFQNLVLGISIGNKLPSLIFSGFAVLAGLLIIVVGLIAELIVHIEYKRNPTSSYKIESRLP
jgi:glycosyltransferase involved in cell wall biosynthesis